MPNTQRDMTNETVTLIFSGIVALSTIAYVILTWKLARETRLSREFNLESHISAYLEVTETTPGIVMLIIKNIGKGIAKNVSFQVSKDIDYPESFSLSDISIFNDGITFFPPDYKFKFILTDIKGHKDRQNDSLTFKITYSDAIKKNRSQWFTLKFSEIKDQGKLTPPETYIGMISYRLEQIKKLLEKKLPTDEK